MRIGLALALFVLAPVAIAADFARGQTWTFGSWPEGNIGRLTVLEIDQTPKLGEVITVSLDETTLPEHLSTVGIKSISHVHIIKSALEASVIEQKGMASAIPDGYKKATRVGRPI